MKQTLLTFFLCIFLIGWADAQVASNGHGLIAQHQTVAKGKLSIFPNPATDYIQLTGTNEVTQINIYNVVGERMLSYDYMEGEKYPVSELPNGMYLVQLISGKAKIIATKRLSKR